MKKFRRLIKYYRVRYKQSTQEERLYLGLWAMLLVTFIWMITNGV